MKLRYNDEAHRYWLNGIPAKGVTTVAKIPDDQYRMNLAAQRKVLVGAATTPKLIEKVAANIDNDKTLNAIVKEAMEAGGGNEGRDRGITAHTLTERHDLGKSIIDTPLSAEIVGGWIELIANAGFKIVPEFVERIICYPDIPLCGRLDRIVQTDDGRLMILDVKGGKWAIKYPHAIAVQLAFYANAPLIAGPLDWKGETTEFEAMPDVDKDWALIAHFPDDGPPDLFDIDIAAGWKAAQKLCLLALKWRKKNDLVRRHEMPDVNLRIVIPTYPEVVSSIRTKPLDEGRDADPAAVAQLRAKVEALPADKVAWLTGLAKAAHGSGHAAAGLSLKQKPSLRRFELARALYALAVNDRTDSLPWLLSAVIDEEPQTSIPLGAYVGSLDVTGATRFAHLVDQLLAGEDVQAAEPQPAA